MVPETDSTPFPTGKELCFKTDKNKRFPSMAEHKSSKIIPFRKVKSYSNLLFIKKRFCFFPDSFLKKHPANKINRTQTKPSFPSVDMAAASPSTSPIKHTNKGLRIHCTSYYIIYSSSVSILIAIFSCTSSSWDRLKKELEWRYICVDKSFRFKKRKQSWVRTEVNFWTTKELENELTDFPALIGLDGEDEDVRFEIMWEGKEGDCPFYKPYTEFYIKEGDNYKKNLEVGTLILQAERKWKRDGGEKKWRKRKAWKTVGGNYKEAK